MGSITSIQLCIIDLPSASKQCVFQTSFIQNYKSMNKKYSSIQIGQLSPNILKRETLNGRIGVTIQTCSSVMWAPELGTPF